MILSNTSCEVLIVQSAPSATPGSTVTAPSVTFTVHCPAPSMSKAYELFIPAVWLVSALAARPSKNSCVVTAMSLLVGFARESMPRLARFAAMTVVEFGQVEADARAVPVAKPLDSNVDARLAKLGETGDLRGDRGEAVLLHLDGERLVAAGVGERDKVDADALRTAGAVAAQALSRVGGTLAWQLDDSLAVPAPEQAAALVEGTILGAYSPGRWKSKNDTRTFERIV